MGGMTRDFRITFSMKISPERHGIRQIRKMTTRDPPTNVTSTYGQCMRVHFHQFVILQKVKSLYLCGIYWNSPFGGIALNLKRGCVLHFYATFT